MRWPLKITVIFIIAQLLWACGGGGGSTSPSPTPASAPAPSPAPSPSPTPSPVVQNVIEEYQYVVESGDSTMLMPETTQSPLVASIDENFHIVSGFSEDNYIVSYLTIDGEEYALFGYADGLPRILLGPDIRIEYKNYSEFDSTLDVVVITPEGSQLYEGLDMGDVQAPFVSVPPKGEMTNQFEKPNKFVELSFTSIDPPQDNRNFSFASISIVNRSLCALVGDIPALLELCSTGRAVSLRGLMTQIEQYEDELVTEEKLTNITRNEGILSRGICLFLAESNSLTCERKYRKALWALFDFHLNHPIQNSPPVCKMRILPDRTFTETPQSIAYDPGEPSFYSRYYGRSYFLEMRDELGNVLIEKTVDMTGMSEEAMREGELINFDQYLSLARDDSYHIILRPVAYVYYWDSVWGWTWNEFGLSPSFEFDCAGASIKHDYFVPIAHRCGVIAGEPVDCAAYENVSEWTVDIDWESRKIVQSCEGGTYSSFFDTHSGVGNCSNGVD